MVLIGSSLARAIREHGLAKKIYGLDTSRTNLAKCNELEILFKGADSLDSFSEQFDLVIICSPLNSLSVRIESNVDSTIKVNSLISSVYSPNNS